MIKSFLAVFFGGGLGCVLRYGVQLLMHGRIQPYCFPWATFTVNIIGSFLIGLFYALSAKLGLSVEVRMFLTAGLCGGFTTFSTFCNDSLALFRNGEYLAFSVYMALSILLGLLAVVMGMYVASGK